MYISVNSFTILCTARCLQGVEVYKELFLHIVMEVVSVSVSAAIIAKRNAAGKPDPLMLTHWFWFILSLSTRSRCGHFHIIYLESSNPAMLQEIDVASSNAPHMVPFETAAINTNEPGC